MTTDHYFSRSDLDSIALQIQSGQEMRFDPKNVADIVALLGKTRDTAVRQTRFDRYCAATVVVLLMAVIVLGIYFAVRSLSK